MMFPTVVELAFGFCARITQDAESKRSTYAAFDTISFIIPNIARRDPPHIVLSGKSGMAIERFRWLSKFVRN